MIRELKVSKAEIRRKLENFDRPFHRISRREKNKSVMAVDEANVI